MASEQPPPQAQRAPGILGFVERVGNKLPDPALLFVFCLIITWILSWLLAPVDFGEVDPRVKVEEGQDPAPLRVENQLTGSAMAQFLASMVSVFAKFPPLGLVLVAMLGVGVAEHAGFIGAGVRWLLSFTTRKLLTPALIFVAIVSHTAADVGYVLVIPLGGVIFYAAGRHPLAGIAAAFAGVSGGFSANFIPSGIDPLLQSFTQTGAQILDGTREVNPLCNWGFTSASCLLIIGLGWFITDKIVEPQLAGTPVDGDTSDVPRMEPLKPAETRGLLAGAVAMLIGLALLVVAALPETSPLRDQRPGEMQGSITSFKAPLMEAIVPLIFLLFLLPGTVYGYVAGTFKSHRDVIKGMSNAMSSMGYYIVMAFFAAQFIEVFGKSNLGALLAVKGAGALEAIGLPAMVTITGIILLTGMVNLLVGSASAKWALLAPIFVPMLMHLGLSPELTQAAYRVGDSTTNIITPLLPYFPLIVVFAKKYYTGTGIGTLLSMMLPYSLVFLVAWTIFLLLYWQLGIPLGINAPYTYP